MFAGVPREMRKILFSTVRSFGMFCLVYLRKAERLSAPSDSSLRVSHLLISELGLTLLDA